MDDDRPRTIFNQKLGSIEIDLVDIYMAITFAPCAYVFLFQKDGGRWLPAIIHTTPQSPAVDVGWACVSASTTVSLAKNTPQTIPPWVDLGVINSPNT